MVIYGIIAHLLVKTNCGQTPTSEIAGLAGLLIFNLLCLLFLKLCFDQETGKLRTCDSAAPDEDAAPEDSPATVPSQGELEPTNNPHTAAAPSNAAPWSVIPGVVDESEAGER